MTKVYETRPLDFHPRVEVSACYLEWEGKLLLLKIGKHKSEGGKWGVPAGKVEADESPIHAARRELFEETGIDAPHIRSLGSLYIRKPNFDYVYHLFQVSCDQQPTPRPSAEHEDFCWATAADLQTLPLMDGAPEALHYYRLRQKLMK
jgi:8-oxo-dGTP pyrophosphatase MutT (NUDIX family)